MLQKVNTLNEAIADYLNRNWKIIPCDGKIPIAKNWPSRAFSNTEIASLLDDAAEPSIGIQLGPQSGLIDFEYDSDEELEVIQSLIPGHLLDRAPFYTSARGGHYLFAWSDDLAAIDKAVVQIGSLKVRVGGSGGAMSIFPPSPNKTWIRHPDEFPPFALPSEVIASLLPQPAQHSTSNSYSRIALSFIANLDQGPEQDGSNRLVKALNRCAGWCLSESEAIATIQKYAESEPFPKEWGDSEIAARYQQVLDRKGNWARYWKLTNYIQDEDKCIPLSMAEVVRNILNRLEGSISLHREKLFAQGRHGLRYLTKAHELTSYLATFGDRAWRDRGNYVKYSELIPALANEVSRYDSIFDLPHEPPLQDCFYTCSIEPGNGEHLNRFVEFFFPETEADRELIKALIATLFYGGETKPMFVISSNSSKNSGRDTGKTSLIQKIGQLVGGSVNFSNVDDIEAVKTRLLSANAPSRLLLIDDVDDPTTIRGLSSLITDTHISGRRLYEGNGHLKNTWSTVLTTNRPILNTDLASRAIIIFLGDHDGNPAFDEQVNTTALFWRPSTLGDCLGIDPE